VISEIDVTEKRRLEAELLQNEKLVAMGQLAATVAHEINNPLAAIIANAQLLLKDTPSQNQDLVESVKLIELAGLRASHVVKNLLGLARKEEYEFAPMDINESIQDALSLLSHEFMSRPIAIRFERGQNLPPIVASRENLESIWINLLMNSIESIGTDSGSIEINTFYDEGNFYVLIRDSGIGVPVWVYRWSRGSYTPILEASRWTARLARERPLRLSCPKCSRMQRPASTKPDEVQIITPGK